MIARVLVAATVGAALLLPAAPASEAHGGASFCEGTFAPTVIGPVRPDGTQFAYGEGECETAFQGFPAGVIGRYETGDATAPAQIHVEVWGATETGQRIKLAECDGPGIGGEAACEFEDSLIGQPLTLPEPLPAIVSIECAGHSHANVKVGTTPVGRFGCYTTDEAEAELRQEMGLS